MSASPPPPERPRAEPSPAVAGEQGGGLGGQRGAAARRRLRRRALLAAWRRRLARALLRRLAANDLAARQAQGAWAGQGRSQGRGARHGAGRGAPSDASDASDARGTWGDRAERGPWPRRLGRQPEHWPRLLLAWQAVLVGLGLALVLQSLLAPRWPRAELPRGWGMDSRLGDRRLRLLATLPGQRDRDRALSETLVLAVSGEEGPGGEVLRGKVLRGKVPGGEAMASPAPRQIPGRTRRQAPWQTPPLTLGKTPWLRPGQTPALTPGPSSSTALMPLLGRMGGEGALELRIVAVQVRQRSDLAVPRVVRDRPDLRLSGLRLERLTPSLSYGRGWLRGRPAWQTCLTGAGQGGYSERQLSSLRDHPLPPGWPQVLYILGLRDNRDFSCLLLTLSRPEKAPDPPATRQPARGTTAP